MNQVPFRRAAYSNLDASVLGDSVLFNDVTQENVIFSGADLSVYINHIKVQNLESITWSTSREVVGNYTMGSADANTYTKGKRVVVGSLVFSQYAKHAFLDQVFDLDRRKITTVKDLWDASSPAERLRTSNANYVDSSTSVRAANGGNQPTFGTEVGSQASFGTDSQSVLGRGLSNAEFQAQLADQEKTAAALVGARKIEYSDQIPAFDLTVIGVVQQGIAARCTIFGLEITQETAGFSQNDIGTSVGLSFVARAVSRWRTLDPTLAPTFFNSR